MKKIPLTQGKFALVDDADYEELIKHKWLACVFDRTSYARRRKRINGKCIAYHMHRLIMNAPDDKHIDHKDGNGLNNQRSNLRICTQAENIRNQGIGKNNTSGYKGVNWCTRNNKWIARVGHKYERVYLGYFTCLIKAAKAYDKVALELHGEFASLNFPKGTL